MARQRSPASRAISSSQRPRYARRRSASGDHDALWTRALREAFEQQPLHAMNEPLWLEKGSTFGQYGEIKRQLRKIREYLGICQRGEVLYQCVTGIDLQRRRRRWYGLSGRLQQPAQLRARLVFGSHEAGR
jgi:hypothetical protein